MQNPKIKAYLALLFAIFVYAIQGVIVKMLTNPSYGFSGVQIVLLRQIGGFLVLLPFVGVMTWHLRHIFWENRLMVIKASVFGIFLHGAAMNIGVEYTTALNLYITAALAPAAAVIISMMIYKQTVSYHTLFYIALSIMGVLIIVSKGNISTITTLQINIGDILVMICTFAWAYFGFALKRKPETVPLSCFMLVGLGIASLLSIPLLWINQAPPITIDMFTWDVIAVVIFLVMGVQVIALFAYGYAASILDGVIPAVGMNLLPLLGSALSVLTLGESFHTYHGIALVIMGIAVYNIVRRDMRKNREHPPEGSPKDSQP